ncbi:MAG TPA: hypothetical protein VFJ85_10255 [Acidimicrobiales bacterium]|nr:hypothetical protein [Acidimicrobiales bacterium]
MRKNLFRGAAAAAGIAFVLVSAGPVQAAGGPSITFMAPLANQQLGSSAVTVTAKADTSGTLVDSITVSVQQTGTSRPPFNSSTPANNSASQTVSVPLTLSYNGTYQATVTATSREGLVLSSRYTNSGQLTFAVAAPPARPSGVKAAVNTDARTVSLSWKANGEPDLLFYLVQRATGTSGDFTVLGKTTDTSFVDNSTAATGGSFRYEVVAVRAGVNSDEGISSDPSAITAESSAAVPAPPPPPTAAPAPAAGTPGAAPAPAAPAAAAGGGTPAGGAAPPAKVPPNSPGALVTSGTVDLSGFAAVKNQGRSTSPNTIALPDPGFQETLPFGTPTTAEGEAGGDDPGALGAGQRALNASDTSSTGDRLRTLSFFAGGLLVTVLLMHVLWVKSEVNRVPLEALEPEDEFASLDASTPGPTLDDIGDADFAPVVVAAANGNRRRRKPPAAPRSEVHSGV